MLNIGDLLDGKYEVTEVLGHGGMSTVYLCKNKRLENLWAIKEVKKEFKDNMDFLTEPNLLKNLSHPGIPRIVDIFYEGDYLYIVEDYIEGETLEMHVKKRGRLESGEIIETALKICDILEYLHSFKPPIIYRDLKPSNIMIKKDGSITLIDFGISRTYKNDKSSDTMLMGSMGYAAPEQYGTMQSGKKTDIYGLGAVMYFMASGKAPSSLLIPLQNESYGDDLTGIRPIIQKAMQIDINDRYSCVGEIRKALADTRLKSNEGRTMLLKKNSEDLTRVLRREEQKKEQFEDKIPSEVPAKPKNKPKKGFKKIFVLIPLALIIMAAAAFGAMRGHMGKYSGNAQNTGSTAPQTSNAPSQQISSTVTPGTGDGSGAQAYGTDSSTTGYIDLSLPINMGSNAPDVPRGKGKNKNRPGSQDMAYQVNPAASASKNDNKLSVQLKYIEQKDNNIVVYCNIVNNTGEDIGFDFNNIILANDMGEYARADKAQSTNLSSIPDDGTDQYAEIVFNNFNVNANSIALMMKINSSDEAYNDKDLNLVVNIK